MKRMVKNGDLIDVEADGTITVAGKPIGGGGGGAKYYPISDFLNMESGSVISGAYNTMLNLIQQGKFLGLSWKERGIVLHYIGEYLGSSNESGILLCYFTAREGTNDSCNFYTFLNNDTFASKDAHFVPGFENMPNYSSTKKYVLKLVNGMVTWVEETL